MIMWNGLGSTKEHMYTSGFPRELAERGIATLMVDCPGSGEALRLQGLTARIDTEAWAAACVEHLQVRSDVDDDWIGLVGWSPGAVRPDLGPQVGSASGTSGQAVVVTFPSRRRG